MFGDSRAAAADGEFGRRQSWRPPPGAARAVAASWIATVLLSAVPAIVCQEVVGSVPSWLPFAQAGVVGALLLTTLAIPRVRPLWRFAVVMAALMALSWAVGLDSFDAPLLQSMLGGTVLDARMQSEQTAKLAVAFAMIAVLLLLRLRPADFFLTPGNLNARIRPVPVLGFPGPDSWRRFGLIWGFGIAIALALVQTLILHPDPSALRAVLPLVPGIVVYAALNAFSEEMTYRAPMLATLESVVGGHNALWQSAFLFGVAHYFGTPGGLLGAVLSIFMGWILSKAMLETRGLFWPWLIHFLSDVVIFTFIALALV